MLPGGLLRPVAVLPRLLLGVLLNAERTVRCDPAEGADRSSETEAILPGDLPDGRRARAGGVAPAPTPNDRPVWGAGTVVRLRLVARGPPTGPPRPGRVESPRDDYAYIIYK